ncbi:ArsC/Spx/MgsR family protein [Marinicella meishanensis]|uniref:ArsC/Spx/MgsR family protein n=1 Tax=Marinicella meishanensis TaxID=2873263 RepID=UPI001CBAB474|nr:ArsC/Spx/MgsR family protein [Marinicella sp. NBU2979]
MIIYGIKNCDKVRAAMKQATANGQSPQLHDFRVDGIDADLVSRMLQDIDLNQLLNKRSTTWKQLDEATKAAADAAVLVAHPTLIKRPVVWTGDHFKIGL